MKKADDFNALIEALHQHRKPKDDQGLTAREIGKRVGHSTAWVCERIREAHQHGCVTIGRRIAQSIDGRQVRVPVYMFKK